MTSLCLTFNLRYDLNIPRIQSLSTGHGDVQISGLYNEVNRSYAFFNKKGKIAGISNFQNLQV